MTGRDLIVLVMENNLENVDIFDKKFIESIMPTVEKVAVTFNVGVATVDAWLEGGCLDGVELDGQVYILPDSLKKFTEKRVNKETNNG